MPATNVSMKNMYMWMKILNVIIHKVRIMKIILAALKVAIVLKKER